MNGSVAAIMGTAIMISSLIVCLRGNSVEAASYEKNVTYLGLWGLEDPQTPENVNDKWNGSYVYFGSYFQDSSSYKQPVKWRVLNYATNDFSRNGDETCTVLLQSDQILDAVKFNEPEDMYYDDEDEVYYVWYMNDTYDCNNYKASNIRKWLNSTEGWEGNYTSGGFYKTAFNEIEQAMLYPSYAETDYSEMMGDFYKTSCGLSLDNYDDYVFLLNIDEATNDSYGFYPLTGNEQLSASQQAVATTYAVKQGAQYSKWWLRAELDESRYNGFISNNGILGTNYVGETTGVRPACNVDEDYIAYTSLLEGTNGQPGAVYKITAIDEAIDLNLTYSGDGKQVVIDYVIGGDNKDNVTQLSYFVSPKDSSQVYAYGKLADVDKNSLNGQVRLDLNAVAESITNTRQACTADELYTDYDIRIAAEQVHVDDPATSTIDESRLTDYASYCWVLDITDEKDKDKETNNSSSTSTNPTTSSNQNDTTTKQKVVKKVVEQVATPAKVGTRYKGTSGAIYKVTSANPSYPEVQYVLAPSKAKGTLEIPDTFTAGKVKYNVTSIANEAVWKSKKIKRVVIGNNVRTIGKKAFYGCKKLKKVVFGTNVTTIGERAFYNCKKIKNLTIPSSVKKIGKEAFRNCTGLKKVKINTLKLKKKTVGKNVFKGVPRSTRFIGKKRRKNYKSIFGL